MKKFPLGLIIYEEDIWGLQSDCATHNIGVEGVGDGAAELPAEGVCVKLLNVHHRGEVFAGEPFQIFRLCVHVCFLQPLSAALDLLTFQKEKEAATPMPSGRVTGMMLRLCSRAKGLV